MVGILVEAFGGVKMDPGLQNDKRMSYRTPKVTVENTSINDPF